MNFTERYIKMCQKAKEVQEGWKRQIGDYVAFPVNGDYVISIITNLQEDSYPPVITVVDIKTMKQTTISALHVWHPAIWLPTVDQLIELYYGTPNVKAREVATDLDCFVDPDWTVDLKEALLRMIMDLKYNKLWNDEDEEWIKVG